MRLTPAYILIHWEQDFDDTKYFTFTPEGDSIGYDIELDQFYYEGYRTEISREEVALLLEDIS